MDLPPDVVAVVGARLVARDRASLACASRRHRSAHDAVVEEDALPERATSLPSALCKARVARLVCSMPGLRTLRLNATATAEFTIAGVSVARAFLELEPSVGRTVHIADSIFYELQMIAQLALDFPGRTSADAVWIGGLTHTDPKMLQLLADLASVGRLVITAAPRTQPGGERTRRLVDGLVRRLVDSLPWAGASIRGASIACSCCLGSTGVEAAALLELVPVPISTVRYAANQAAEGLTDVLAEIRARPPDAARALLARVADVELFDSSWTDASVARVFDAMRAIASLPAACSVSFAEEVCRNPLVVPLVQELLARDGGGRARVRIVCGNARPGRTPPPHVQVVLACVAEPRRLRVVDALGRELEHVHPLDDLEAALERLVRSDPAAAGSAALWRRMGRLGRAVNSR
jgi:hypothetical protein